MCSSDLIIKTTHQNIPSQVVKQRVLDKLKNGEKIYKKRIIASWNNYELKDDIYGVVGGRKVLLLSKENWKPNTAALALLSKYKLTRPVDENIQAKHSVDLTQMTNELDRVKGSLLTYQLPDFTNSMKLIKSLVKNMKLDQAMLNKMALLRDNSPKVYDHSILSAFLALEVGAKLGFDTPKLIDCFSAGLFHNIGNLYINPDLFKKTSLTDDEKSLIEAHPVAGYQILKQSGLFSENMLNAVLDHHELLDGTGYPRSLKGYEIGLEAKILGAVSTYCSLICSGKSENVSLDFMRSCAKTHDTGREKILPKFNAKIVEILSTVIQGEVVVEKQSTSWSQKVLINEIPRVLHYVEKIQGSLDYYVSDCVYRHGKEELMDVEASVEQIYYDLNRSGLTMILEHYPLDAIWEEGLCRDMMLIMSGLLKQTEKAYKNVNSLSVKAGVPSMADLNEYIGELMSSLKAISQHSLHTDHISYLHS